MKSIDIPTVGEKQNITLKNYHIKLPPEVENQIDKIILTEGEIEKRVKKLALEICKSYKQYENVTIVPILTGAFMFASDLSKEIARISNLNINFDFIKVSSYNGKKQEEVKIELEPNDLKDKHVLLLDDVLDQGTTLSTIKKKIIDEWGAKNLMTCVLFHKMLKNPSDEIIEKRRGAAPNFIGFNIELKERRPPWLGGFGLDSGMKDITGGELRHLPYLVSIKE